MQAYCAASVSSPVNFCVSIRKAGGTEDAYAGRYAEALPCATENASASVSDRFAAEMARRLAAASARESQGNAEDYHPLLDSLVNAMDFIEGHADAATATAARAIVLRGTSDTCSKGNLVAGLCKALCYVHDNVAPQAYTDIVSEWNRVDLDEVLAQDGKAGQGEVDGIAYAIVKYFNEQVGISSTSGSARMLLFQGSGGEGSEVFSVVRDLRYVFGQEVVSSIGVSSAASGFKTALIKDGLGVMDGFLRQDLKSEKAANMIESLPESDVFEEGMAKIFSIIYREQGLNGLSRAVDFFNKNISELINAKVAPYYANSYGDRARFAGVAVNAPLPESKKTTCEVSFDWGLVCGSDGRFGVEGTMHWSMDTLSEGIDQTITRYKGDVSTDLCSRPASSPGILVDKTA